MAAETVKRKLKAILAVDAVGCSRLVPDGEGATFATPRACLDAATVSFT